MVKIAMGENDSAVRALRTRRRKTISITSMVADERAHVAIARRLSDRAEDLWDRSNAIRYDAEEIDRKARAASEHAAGVRGILRLMDEAGGAIGYVERGGVIEAWVMADGSEKSASLCPVHGAKTTDDCPHAEPEAIA